MRTLSVGWYDGICVRGRGLVDGEEDREQESDRLITGARLECIYSISDLTADK